MDVLHKVMNWIDHNRGLAISLVLTLLLSVWIGGCQPKTTSLINPEEKVTMAGLDQEIAAIQGAIDQKIISVKAAEKAINAEIDATNRKIENAERDIEQQVATRTKLLEMAGAFGQTVASGGLSAPGAINAILTGGLLLATGGLAYDNRRKNRIIKNGESG